MRRETRICATHEAVSYTFAFREEKYRATVRTLLQEISNTIPSALQSQDQTNEDEFVVLVQKQPTTTVLSRHRIASSRGWTWLGFLSFFLPQ